ncbi:MAG: AAA family ATPase [Xanthobacteraceae bacterium]
MPLAPVDQWLVEIFANLIEAQRDAEIGHNEAPLVELDQPANIEWAIHYLKTDALPAIEGSMGDQTTLKVAMTLRGRGISREKCLELMWDNYNEKCIPAWSQEDMQRKVDNAYQYAHLEQPGAATAESEFDDLTPEEIAAFQAQDDAFHAKQAEKPKAKKEKLKASTALQVVWANTITLESLKWIWEGHLALGQHTIIAGVQGDGKSQLVYAVIAAITTGGTWAGSNEKAPLGICVVLCAEDTAKDVLGPRLVAAGADMRRVCIIKGARIEEGDSKAVRKFRLLSDLRLLEQTCKEISGGKLGDVKMISIDPISSYLGGDLDSHSNTELRDALDPIKDLAENTGSAVLSVTHFNKATKGVSALNRVMGSVAFTAAPRAAFVVLRDEHDKAKRLLLPVKLSLVKEADAYGMAFRIEEVNIGVNDPTSHKPIFAPRIVWGDRDERTADSVLNPVKVKEEGSAVSEAMNFLHSWLEDSSTSKLARDIEHEAAEMCCFSPATLRRAREKMGVVTRKLDQEDGHGPYEWSLPPDIEGILS